MGLFDFLKKNKDEKTEENNAVSNNTTDNESLNGNKENNAVDENTAVNNAKTNHASDSESDDVVSVGWDAIEEEFLRVYPGQTNPKHFATMIKWVFGGNDPLDGISIYDGGTYWHFVTFGLTEIYDKECDDKEISGYGYELTLKLKKYDFEDEEGELKNICGILQSIARLTFKNGEIFLPNEFIYTGQTNGMDMKQKSNITGFITVADTSVNTIDTPNGKVEFLELIGMTDAELKTLSNKQTVIDIYNKLGSDLTDYRRNSIV